MLKKYTYLIGLIVLAITISSCSEDDNYEPTPVSPVVFDINAVPYNNLTEYNFFNENLADLDPVYGVVPYTLQNPLFTDYAKKKRFIWMPNDVSANYNGDHNILEFPVGTILIKNFYYENVLPDLTTKILETRLMINKSDGWIFATYKWNEEQTEAVLDMNGSFTNLNWLKEGVENNVNYRIPAGPECHTCHKTGDVSIPIGPKPRNLNLDYNFSDGNMNQLEKLVEMGYLNDNLPANIETLVSWKDTNASLNERVRSYVDINCAHCHTEEAHCAYRPIRFDYLSTSEPLNLGVCLDPDTDLGNGLNFIVTPSIPLRSVMYYRINSTDVAVRMPLLGRTVIHEEGVALVEEWINSLEDNCQ